MGKLDPTFFFTLKKNRCILNCSLNCLTGSVKRILLWSAASLTVIGYLLQVAVVRSITRKKLISLILRTCWHPRQSSKKQTADSTVQAEQKHSPKVSSSPSPRIAR